MILNSKYATAPVDSPDFKLPLTQFTNEWLNAHDVDAALLVGAKMLLYIEELHKTQSHFSSERLAA